MLASAGRLADRSEEAKAEQQGSAAPGGQALPAHFRIRYQQQQTCGADSQLVHHGKPHIFRNEGKAVGAS